MEPELETRLAAVEIGLAVALNFALRVQAGSHWGASVPRLLQVMDERIDGGLYPELVSPEAREGAKIALHRLLTPPVLSYFDLPPQGAGLPT